MVKPNVSMESQELLVQQYKHLRQRGTGGSARITVRQLESMFRLSESFARLYCSEEVTDKHMKEVYNRLHNKRVGGWVFRVDQPDLDIYNDASEEVTTEDAPMETDKAPEPT